MLPFYEKLDATEHFFRTCLPGSHQGEQGPGGLEGRTRRRHPCFPWVEVSIATFAPASIRSLLVLQPIDRPLNLELIGGDIELLESSEHRPRPINVIRSPATKPGT